MLLPYKNSAGDDNLSNLLLRKLANIVKGLLTVILTKSENERVLLSFTKTVKVMSLYIVKEHCLLK